MQADSDYLTNEPVVAFRFDSAAKERFADFTSLRQIAGARVVGCRAGRQANQHSR
jgi:preprotein translocase subunit SecD